jgi:hypothetical protein
MTSFQGESAKIYEFPRRGRFAAAAQREEASAALAAPRVACGGAWYHDEAIQEAERARKN